MSAAMKLVMTLLVRDEEDIVRENLDFHLAQGVDEVIVTDNGSEDAHRSRSCASTRPRRAASVIMSPVTTTRRAAG